MTVLPDLLGPELAILFCGTAAGNESARRNAYYAGRGNKFWRTLYEVKLTPRVLLPEEYSELLAHGLGLTDLAKSKAGMDDKLTSSDFSREHLRAALRKWQPAIVAFTSKRAAKEYFGKKVDYGPQKQSEGSTAFFVLTSPSGAGNRWWSIEPWKRLALMKGSKA